MHAPTRLVGLTLIVLALTALTGCPDSRTNNQGGGSLLSIAGTLLANPSDPPIGELNPDEWQVLADNIETLAPQFGVTLPANFVAPEITDEQAADITTFLDEYSVDSISDLQDLAGPVQAGEIEVPASLIELAESLGIQLS